jgi:Tfp pilus assembly protein PilZ
MSGESEEQRNYRRHSSRLPCEFLCVGKKERGFITNLSARGFFIQSRTRLAQGEEVIVTIDDVPTPPIVVTALIARAKRVHPSTTAVEQPGIGVQIQSAPEDYYRLVLEIEEKE